MCDICLITDNIAVINSVRACDILEGCIYADKCQDIRVYEINLPFNNLEEAISLYIWTTNTNKAVADLEHPTPFSPQV